MDILLQRKFKSTMMGKRDAITLPPTTTWYLLIKTFMEQNKWNRIEKWICCNKYLYLWLQKLESSILQASAELRLTYCKVWLSNDWRSNARSYVTKPSVDFVKVAKQRNKIHASLSSNFCTLYTYTLVCCTDTIQSIHLGNCCLKQVLFLLVYIN